MRSIGLSLLGLLFASSTFAGTTSDVIVKQDGTVGPIGTSMSHYADTTGTMHVEDVARTATFVPCALTVPLFAVSKQAHWLRFHVLNVTDEPKLMLTIPYPLIDEIDVYMNSGHGFQCIASGGLLRKRATDQMGMEFVIDLPIAKNNAGDVYIRTRGFKPIHVPVMIGTPSTLSRYLTDRYPALGGYAGIMLVLALYNLFVFLSTRDRNYFLYVLSILAVCVAQLAVLGYGPFELFPVGGWLASRSSLLSMALAVPLGLEFARRFIGTQSYTPTLHKFAPAIYVLLGCICLINMFGDPWLGYKLAQAASGSSAIYLLTMSIIAVRKGSRQARFFLLAWAGFLVGVVMFVLKDEGVIPYDILSVYAMPVGSVVEGVLLSFGLADRINILRREKERSQAEALASAQENARITRDQNVILEQKVTERTHQLQESLDQLKQAQSQLVEAKKMSSLGQLTAGIAHEINNPVNYIRSNIPPLKRDMADLLEVLAAYRVHGTSAEMSALEAKLGLDETIQEVNDILHSMEEGANRTAEIVRGLRTFSRLDEGDLKHGDINEGIRSTLNILASQVKDRVAVELDLRDLPEVECYPGKLNQVFMNMLNNAVQAVLARHGEQGGRISVITDRSDDQAVISILDNGIGMPAETRARVFEPFFTTKAVGEGTGLGLSIAHSIIEKHNGRIEVESIVGQGTEFRIIIPLVQHAQLAKSA